MDNNHASWPGWETVRLIGRGSFGAVYEIRRDMLGEVERAALKVISIPQNESDIEELHSDGYDDESITNVFQNHLKSILAEYALMRKLNGCTNIVSCDDVRYIQHDDGIGWDIFIKMELLTPLTKALPADIPEGLVVKLAKDICTALMLCKKHNIVHRDIKPQNIFVSEYGDYKLGDFGIAKTVEQTTSGTKIGTCKYMAPEVFLYQPYGSAADIYSLGLVLYWLLNERRIPFMPLPPAKMTVTMEDQAKERRLRGEPLPPPAHGSEKLKAIVLKACAYDPAQRYRTATEMLQALESMSAPPPAHVPTLTPEPLLVTESVPVPTPIPMPVPAPQTAAEPKVQEVKYYIPLPNDGWQCACGRENRKYVSSCACGLNKRELQVSLKTQNIPPKPVSTPIPVSAPAPQTAAEPKEQEVKYYIPLPNDGWQCACGRENRKYVSSCACGLNKRDLQVSLKTQKMPPNANWQCICGRTNAHYVTNCACGAKKRDIIGL